jgi:hypothetical protein
VIILAIAFIYKLPDPDFIPSIAGAATGVVLAFFFFKEINQ